MFESIFVLVGYGCYIEDGEGGNIICCCSGRVVWCGCVWALLVPFFGGRFCDRVILWYYFFDRDGMLVYGLSSGINVHQERISGK